MRIKNVIFLLTALIFASCTPKAENVFTRISEIEEIVPNNEYTTPNTMPPEETEAPAPTVSPHELSHIDLSFLIDVNWREQERETGAIEFKVFPLPDQWGVTYTRLTGEVVFFDEELNVFPLPFQPRWWMYVNERYARNPVAYALLCNTDEALAYSETRAILMLPDGTIPEDDEGYIELLYSYYDGYFIINAIDNIVITKGENGLGLYDISQRTEILPRTYDSIFFADTIFYVVHNGTAFLYDMGEIFSFGELTEEELQRQGRHNRHFIEIFNNYIYRLDVNTQHGGSTFDEYFLNANERLFFRQRDNPFFENDSMYEPIRAWGDYLVFLLRNENYLYVSDRDGNVLFQGEYRNFAIVGDYLVLYTDTGFIVADKEFNLRHFPIPRVFADSIRRYPRIHNFDGDVIIYSSSFFDTYLLAVDETGTVTEYKERDRNRIIFQNGHYHLTDNNGNILLSAQETRTFLDQAGEFVILSETERDGGGEIIHLAVYSLDGSLLMDELYAVAATALNNGIFVYITPDHCVVLHTDGTTIHVINAPTVVRQYIVD